ncbi:MAG: hypothetical protein ACXVCY_01975 [Pseudobdellovibrionaceae bacterium]
MSSKSKSTHAELDHILNFVDASKGLRAKINEAGRVQVFQDIDGKVFSFSVPDVSEVLHRADSEGKSFIQINFKIGTKVLLTDTLIGFKPQETLGLDMTRIPKVVTTPDLVSVFDAIEESLGSDSVVDHEVEILKKVYMSIVCGAENVGFELTVEKNWINRLIASRFNPCA